MQEAWQEFIDHEVDRDDEVKELREALRETLDALMSWHMGITTTMSHLAIYERDREIIEKGRAILARGSEL